MLISSEAMNTPPEITQATQRETPTRNQQPPVPLKPMRAVMQLRLDPSRACRVHERVWVIDAGALALNRRDETKDVASAESTLQPPKRKQSPMVGVDYCLSRRAPTPGAPGEEHLCVEERLMAGDQLDSQSSSTTIATCSRRVDDDSDEPNWRRTSFRQISPDSPGLIPVVLSPLLALPHFGKNPLPYLAERPSLCSILNLALAPCRVSWFRKESSAMPGRVTPFIRPRCPVPQLGSDALRPYRVS
ncbi:hypothetical protein B0H12DRAFT_1113055 [Mycena haematopus]|nr:hypothetical protein B0H12DRAFT_1113055 [Mycena haematopus]